MSTQVTEARTGTGFVQGLSDGQWQAIRKFHVVGVDPASAKFDALTAVNDLGVFPGTGHPLNSRLICQTVGVDDNFVRPEVTATYAISMIAFDTTLFKTRWRWQPGSVPEPADFDFYGNPVTDSAGSPFDPPLPTYRGTLSVTAYRNEPFFDLPSALQYRNKTNSVDWTTPMGVLHPGQAYCVNVYPMIDIYAGIPYVQVGYDFQLEEGELLDGSDEYNGFFTRVQDAGLNGWGADDSDQTVFGIIVGPDGQPVQRPCPLDGSGKPIESGFYIFTGQNNSSPRANPHPLPSKVGKTTKTVDGRTYTFLSYRRRGVGVIDFNGLNL